MASYWNIVGKLLVNGWSSLGVKEFQIELSVNMSVCLSVILWNLEVLTHLKIFSYLCSSMNGSNNPKVLILFRSEVVARPDPLQPCHKTLNHKYLLCTHSSNIFKSQ